MISRRALLASASLALPLAVVGCASTPPAISTVASDVADIANGLAGVLPELGTISGLPQATITTVSGYVTDLITISHQVAKATTTAQAQPLVKQVETIVNAIVAALATMTLPSPIGPAIAAAAALLPVIEAAIGLIVTPPAKASATLKARAAAMTPDQARLILQAAAHGR